MYRTFTCGELREEQVGQTVLLAGWVNKIRRMGGMTFIDLRDRYGLTQLVIDAAHQHQIEEVGREWVLQAEGVVQLRSNVNDKIPTGKIEIEVTRITVLNPSATPPFTIEEQSDGGDDLRMKYRYLDLRRTPVLNNIKLRHKTTMEVRRYLDQQGFLEIETPMLIGSTPEGARDFVVPSRMNPGQFYALPQSPQTFKQLLMVAGMDKYFQIVKCFRDEDLRADRQPEFTQIDCEMSFVEQDDILALFEGLVKHLFAEIKGVHLTTPLRRISWEDAMEYYGSDKPDLRADMKIMPLTKQMQGVGFSIIDNAEYVGGIVVPGGAKLTRKQIDHYTDFVKRPQVGAGGLIWMRQQDDGSLKSSVDKFYQPNQLADIAQEAKMAPGDLLFVMSGKRRVTQKQLGTLRLHLMEEMGLMDKNRFECLWVVDFPLLEWDDETNRYYAMHHPFTAPKPEDIPLLTSNPGDVRANAYDLVINGVEVGGGSIRIHDAQLQQTMFGVLGFTPQQAQQQFGFLMDAFTYGAPPHGGIAFGLDRWVSIFAGLDSIRDCIAFPKNTAGRDVMIDAPAALAEEQLQELSLELRPHHHNAH